VVSAETGITVSAKINSQFERRGVATEQLEEWLRGVLAASPSLKLFFNGRQLQAPPQSDGSYLDDVKPASMKNTGVDQAGRDDAGDG